MPRRDPPASPGTYVLVMESRCRGRLTVGRLGELALEPGWFLYVGSARGPGGLQARLCRHQRSSLGQTARHWHIDHLLAAVSLVEIWYAASDLQLECRWAASLAAADGCRAPLPAFGSSDCRCLTHLQYVADSRALPRLRRKLPRSSGGATIRVNRPLRPTAQRLS